MHRPPFQRSSLAIAAMLVMWGSAHAQVQVQGVAAQTLQEINVNASADASAEGLPAPYAGGQVARGGRVGILGNVDNMESPFTSTSYTQELIQNQQARSVADVMQNDPSVRVARGFGNFQELYVIRGFNVYSDDMSYNGLYGLLPRQYVAAELLERVEVFRGASAFLNGAAPGSSGIGGTVNVLPKRAPNDPLTQVTAGAEGGGQGYLATDLARRFGPDKSTGLRFNAVRRDGETSVENEERELSALALGLDWRSRDVRLSADVGYQNHKVDQPRPSVTPGDGIPKAPDASKNFAQPWTYSDARDVFGTVRGEVDLSDKVTAWAAMGMREGDEENVLANPRGATADGSTSTYRFDNVRDDSVKTGEVGVRGELQTGSVRHQLTASASVYTAEERNAYGFSDFAGFAGNLYDPVAVAAPAADFFTGGSLDSPRVVGKTDLSSIALADSMSFANDRVIVTLGARRQTIKNKTFNYSTGERESAYDKSKVTPMAGVVLKASDQMSVYANYIEGLVQGDISPLTTGFPAVPVTNGGQAFSPYVSKQKEVGLKYDGGKLGGSLAYFTTDKPTGYVDASNTFVADGEQRNRGVELGMYGELQRGLRVLGGVTWLNAEQVNSSVAANNGKDVIGTPDTQVNAGLEWDVPGMIGLTLTGRAIYTSAQYADAANSLKVPSWTRLDLGARYLTEIGGKLVSLRARIDNATDKDYWASAGGYPGQGYLVLGAPRTLMVSASLDF